MATAAEKEIKDAMAAVGVNLSKDMLSKCK